MNQALPISAIEKVGLSLKTEEKKVSEPETIEVKEVKASEIKITARDRFARLKKSLRKRSASIL